MWCMWYLWFLCVFYVVCVIFWNVTCVVFVTCVVLYMIVLVCVCGEFVCDIFEGRVLGDVHVANVLIFNFGS